LRYAPRFVVVCNGDETSEVHLMSASLCAFQGNQNPIEQIANGIAIWSDTTTLLA